MRKGHDGYDFMSGLYENDFGKDEETELDPKLFNGTSGKILLSEENVPYSGVLKSPIRGLLELDQNQVVW